LDGAKDVLQFPPARKFVKPNTFVQMAAFCGIIVQSLAQSPTNWQVRAPLPPAVDLVSITHGSGGFVLADDGGFVSKSTDGKTWTRFSGPPNPKEVVYEEGRYVAVCGDPTSDGYIFSSIDGSSWQYEYTTVLGDLAGIAYGNGKYVAVGQSGIWVSDDGDQWTAPNPSINEFYRDVVFGNGKFVAVGNQFTNGGYQARIASSSNGVDWTFVTLPETNFLRAVGAGNGAFVASGDGRPILTSSDAEQWTLQGFFPGEPHNPPATDIRAIAYGNGTFVAGGKGHRIYYSADGTNWIGGCFNCYGPSWTPFAPVKSIAYGNGQFIALAEGGMMYATADPRQWTIVRSENDLYSAAYGNGTFVAVGSDATIWVSSNTSGDWSYVFGGLVDSSPVFGINSVAFGNNLFAAVGGPGPYAALSADGVQWTRACY
jgi:hypothetical protein